MTAIAKPPNPPGSAADLPPSSLPKPFLGPQGDENRDPPANAPAPVQPAVKVDDSAGSPDRPEAPNKATTRTAS